MKILMLSQYLTIGGLEKMIFLLAKGLQTHSQEVGVYVYDHPKGSETLEVLFKKHQIPVEFYPKQAGFSLETVRKISRSVIENSYEVIHTHDLGALIYGIFVKYYILFTYWKKIPVVHTQHSFVHLNRGKLYPAFEKIFTRLANRVCVVHKALLQWYVKLHIPINKIAVISNGVMISNEIFNISDKIKLKNKLLEDLALTKNCLCRMAATAPYYENPAADFHNKSLIDKNWLLSLGRLCQSKGTLDLLNIWKQLDSNLQQQSCLFIVGPFQDEQARAELLLAWRTLPLKEHVFFVGTSYEPEDWYRGADLFISASHFEGHSLALVEALGNGLPAIVSDIPGHQMASPEVMSYFSLGDYQNATKLLSQLLTLKATNEDNFIQMHWNNGRYYRENFSHIQMAQKYLDLYTNL